MSESNNPKSYAGFTIGPIYDVLSHARKTRELWFGSYFFSWFMERMIEQLSQDDDIDFITPYVQKPFIQNHSRIGKYHDRFVIASKLDQKQLFEAIRTTSDRTLGEFAQMIYQCPGGSNIGDLSEVQRILTDYIQRKFIVLRATEITDGANPAAAIDPYLDTVEENLHFALGTSRKTCDRCKTLPGVKMLSFEEKENNVPVKKERPLCPICFIKYMSNRSQTVSDKVGDFRYPMILEIAARDLLFDSAVQSAFAEVIREEDDDNFEAVTSAYRTVFKKDPDTKPFHKYYAVVQADGDDLGNLASQLDAQALSKRLFSFANKAEEVVEKYHGEAIYVGGDDILAFIPVAFHEGRSLKTILDFAVEISQVYTQCINNDVPEDKWSSLSMGINIAYFKFPLVHALESARDQLGRAKERPGKNAVAVCLTKHSGFQMSFAFTFGTPELRTFSDLMRSVLGGVVDIPHAVHHKLAAHAKLLSHLQEESLRVFMDNVFNEPIHAPYRAGLNKICEMLALAIQTRAGDNKEDAVKDVLNKLRFLKFLRGDK